MGQKSQVLVDTDILIKVFRGHTGHRIILESEKGNLSISSVKTRARVIDLHKQMKAYRLLHLSEAVSQKSLELLNKYGIKNSMRPGDALIAATSIVHHLLLFTDNKQDFDFIKAIRLY